MVKVLVVDDEPLICETLEDLLQRAGHQAHTAADGVQAIKCAKQVKFDLIIMDIVMPEKDGLETIQSIREEHPDLKIIAISGGSRIGNVDFLKFADEFGAWRTFRKPLDNVELLNAVEESMMS